MLDEQATAAAQKMQDYIGRHLTEEISLGQLAAACGYSPWHAARIFREATGKTPFSYIRSLRLTEAALALRDGDERVLDVALSCDFDSHEGFSRAFAREFGVSPSRYRRTAPAVPFYKPYPVYDTYRHFHKGEFHMNEQQNTKSVFVRVEARPARKVLLRRGKKAEEYFAYCEEVGCDVWGVLCSVKEALYEPMGMWLPACMVPEGTSQYVQGVELPLDYDKEIPAGFELIELPPYEVMIFQGEPYDDEAFGEAIAEMYRHIARFDPTLYGYRWAPETGPRFQPEPQGKRGYIEAAPVEKL